MFFFFHFRQNKTFLIYFYRNWNEFKLLIIIILLSLSDTQVNEGIFLSVANFISSYIWFCLLI